MEQAKQSTTVVLSAAAAAGIKCVDTGFTPPKVSSVSVLNPSLFLLSKYSSSFVIVFGHRTCLSAYSFESPLLLAALYARPVQPVSNNPLSSVPSPRKPLRTLFFLGHHAEQRV